MYEGFGGPRTPASIDRGSGEIDVHLSNFERLGRAQNTFHPAISAPVIHPVPANLSPTNVSKALNFASILSS
jgi:hypothetical protein